MERTLGSFGSPSFSDDHERDEKSDDDIEDIPYEKYDDKFETKFEPNIVSEDDDYEMTSFGGKEILRSMEKSEDTTFFFDRKIIETDPPSNIVPQLNEWVDLLDNGTLMKKIIKYGKVNTKVHVQDMCVINYTSSLQDGTQIEHEEGIMILMGDLEVIQGVDIALAYMSHGEMCQLIIGPSLAFGAKGWDNKVPPNATICYDLELINVIPACQMNTMSMEHRKHMGELKRKRGNWWYARNEWAFAIQCYRRALEYLDGNKTYHLSHNFNESGQGEGNDLELQEIRVNVCNNMAVAQMKLGHFDAAIQPLQVVLQIQPNNIKALYRMSKVMQNKVELQEALKYLKKALDFEPENNMIKNEVHEMTNTLKKHKACEKELAKRMFNSTSPLVEPKNPKVPHSPINKCLIWTSVIVSVAITTAGLVAWRLKMPPFSSGTKL